MKRAASILLVGVMALSLAACGKTAKESPAPATTAPVETTAPVTATTTPVDETAPAETGTPNEEEHAVSGVVNKLEDYLVLVVGDDYQVFDFAKDLKVDDISEGDEVTVVYTGTLGDEQNPPVVIEIAKN